MLILDNLTEEEKLKYLELDVLDKEQKDSRR